MGKLPALIRRYREQLLYLIFGVCTTAVNICAYWLLRRYTALPTSIGNALAIALSIVFAYVTNRIWVFRSRARGGALLKEMAEFFGCRIGTGLLDELLVVAGVEWLGLWDLGVKAAASVIVIVANYVFSKLIIFKER